MTQTEIKELAELIALRRQTNLLIPPVVRYRFVNPLLPRYSRGYEYKAREDKEEQDG